MVNEQPSARNAKEAGHCSRAAFMPSHAARFRAGRNGTMRRACGSRCQTSHHRRNWRLIGNVDEMRITRRSSSGYIDVPEADLI